MPTRFTSFLVAVAIIALVAVAAPAFAPGLLASFTRATDEPAAAPLEPPPAVQVKAPAAAPVYSRIVPLRADPSGHFRIDAAINGRDVPVMVDTGATMVALTEATARRLGIVPRKRDYTMQVATANGVIRAAPVTLAEVRIGPIRLRNVEATVIAGEALGMNLLGMSFLSRLTRFESVGGQLVLYQ